MPDTSTIIFYTVPLDSILLFRAEVFANQPLHKSQEIETWIQAIKNIVRPKIDEARISAARSHVRGNMEAIVNSRHFDNITNWNAFKGHLWAKFRGTCSSSHFNRLLAEDKMKPDQAPWDSYMQLDSVTKMERSFRGDR